VKPTPDGSPLLEQSDAGADAARDAGGSVSDAPHDLSNEPPRDVALDESVKPADQGADAPAPDAPRADVAADVAPGPEPVPDPAPDLSPPPDAASQADAPIAAPPRDTAIDVPAAVDAPVDGPPADLPPADAAIDGPVLPNIGAWCDPALSDGALDNPACVGGTRCLIVRDPTDGLCTIFGCSVDLPTAGVDEESCSTTYGAAYVCVDLDGSVSDPLEPYDPPTFPDGQNADLVDNVCLERCTPREDGNDCHPAFACAPDSTRLHFGGGVCYFVACADGTDCPVTTSAPGTCAVDGDCDTGAGEFCTGVQDLDGDGALEVRACAERGTCNPDNGLCDPHALGAPAATIGDPCAFDTECPDGSTCVLEAPVYDTEGSIVALVPRNGYCTKLGCRFDSTLTSATCPIGHECNQNYFAGGCQPSCDVNDPWGCRNNDCDPGSGLTSGCDWFGDLDCYDWSGWSFPSGLQMVRGPTGIVCDYDGPGFNTCEDIWYASGGLGCPGVAPVGNPAAMDCRDRETAALTVDDADPLGRCLDVTSSGPVCADHGRFCDGVCVDTGGGPCP